MSKFLLGFIATYSLVINAFSQSVNTIIGGRTSGLAGSSAVISDISATSNNIGALSLLERTSFAFSTEIHPALPGSIKASSVFAFPTKLGVTGISVFRFGDNLYNEFIFGAGHSHKIGISSLGLRANYIQYHSETFGNKRAFRLDFGYLTTFNKNLFIGAYILNITKSKLSTEPLPTKFIAGIGFKPIEHIYIISEIEKSLTNNATFKLGIEYIVYKKFFLRTGIKLSPNVGFGGFGAKIKNFIIDYAMTFSQLLGNTQCASIAYELTRRRKK